MHLFLLFAFAVPAAVGGFAAGWLICRSRTQAQAGAERAATEAAAALVLDQLRDQARGQIAERDARIEALRAELAEAQMTVARMEGEATRLPELRGEIFDLKSERDELHLQLQRALGELAQTRANLDNERRQTPEKLALVTGAQEDMKNWLTVTAAEVLKAQSATFTAENQSLLKPVREQLTELGTHVGTLNLLAERTSSDTRNFVNIMTGSSKRQGEWGDFILENILKECGLREGHDYRPQESFSTADGTRARPDVVVNLSADRHMVIDAKVSLVDYHAYCTCDDEAKREASLARHLAAVRTHLKELSERSYQSLRSLSSLDFVVMFVPIEPAFLIAIERDKKLLQDAWNKNVLLVSASTLLVVLRMIADLSRQARQAREVQKIVDLGRGLYDKFAALVEDLTNVGNKLNSARDAHDQAMKRLRSGRGNAIQLATELKDSGIKPTRSLPQSMVEAALDDCAPLLGGSLVDGPEFGEESALTLAFAAHSMGPAANGSTAKN